MKVRLMLVLFGVACITLLPAVEPAVKPVAADQPPVLVAVHGAWAGGWHFKKIAPLLEAKGWQVHRPTLSGLGERFHTVRADFALATHIDDIVNYILFAELHDVILLGHSYGGMVITGVADRIPSRIAQLIYLDAFLPDNGENVLQLRKPGSPVDFTNLAKDGLIPAWWVRSDKPFPIDVPHPLKTFTDPIALQNQAMTAKIARTYILTVDPGKPPADDDFFAASERARARGWPVKIMEGDHNPHWRQPEVLAEILLGLR